MGFILQTLTGLYCDGKSDKDILVEKVNVSNGKTINAMKEAEAGRVTMVDSVDELLDSI